MHWVNSNLFPCYLLVGNIESLRLLFHPSKHRQSIQKRFSCQFWNCRSDFLACLITNCSQHGQFQASNVSFHKPRKPQNQHFVRLAMAWPTHLNAPWASRDPSWPCGMRIEIKFGSWASLLDSRQNDERREKTFSGRANVATTLFFLNQGFKTFHLLLALIICSPFQILTSPV